MTLSAHTMKTRGGRKAKRVGRGNGSGKGTYSARGMKGQRARSGGKAGLQRRGFKPSLQKVPKLRGFSSLQEKKNTVTLAMLNATFEEGMIVTPKLLESKGLVAHAVHGVKIVASGTLKKKLTIQDCLASKAAAEVIEKAGGTITF
ncbi:MAG: 50S ribosomal protein L15 [Candidatus Magasanikbacteria bacterium CG10_big_fil_rev_8_21_14_0_10_47_10]|uniref:Large ribosomal subunit protein uL15 n=1 Tax=Candidatus Magasanikbacteria bacterium CG10_big_fil_rev_8_21_14_0_10_47_10 TaxID=1974652 RepID=A0A2H0TP81_9BACT|nr:MAG: 50S ribosomal protein L15 [Candidatus Magasanikbacteria bacterium CG10_big_fil_rev_8_21_14_0_10_47_10]